MLGGGVGGRAARRYEGVHNAAHWTSRTEAKPETRSGDEAHQIPIGHRFGRGQIGGRVILDAALLPRHISIIAGAGSGKTILLRRGLRFRKRFP